MPQPYDSAPLRSPRKPQGLCRQAEWEGCYLSQKGLLPLGAWDCKYFLPTPQEAWEPPGEVPCCGSASREGPASGFSCLQNTSTSTPEQSESSLYWARDPNASPKPSSEALGELPGAPGTRMGHPGRGRGYLAPAGMWRSPAETETLLGLNYIPQIHMFKY